jgi:hypothetical protein
MTRLRTVVQGRLCYVRQNVAWFTTAPLAEQWGDDWSDEPFWCNAREPYAKPGVTLTKVHFTPGYLDDWENSARYLSVQQINNGDAPWLHSINVNINAGVTFDEFQALLLKAGGTALRPW